MDMHNKPEGNGLCMSLSQAAPVLSVTAVSFISAYNFNDLLGPEWQVNFQIVQDDWSV